MFTLEIDNPRRMLDAELSDVCWTARDARAVADRIHTKGRSIMKRKASMALLLGLAVLALAVGALAATGVVFGRRVERTELAERTLEERYGITQPMLGFFQRSVEEDGAVIRYTGTLEMEYVLGEYTVTFEEGNAQVSWSWDGTPVAQDIDAAPWGAAQLQEMADYSRREMNIVPYMEKAEALAAAAGHSISSQTLPSVNMDTQAYAQEREAVKVRMRFAREELVAMAREAIVARYGMDDAVLPYLEDVEENDRYSLDGSSAYLELYIAFGHDNTAREHPEWSEHFGIYSVQMDVESGVVEDMLFDSSLGGNG